ncbi:MAG: sulfotransferase [Acidimicrobiales bacterium]
METNTAPDGVVVLGMHRSGTSAVAGLLAKAGFFTGQHSELLAPAEDNPTGFFERLDVNALNDKLLGELGRSWDNPPARQLVHERAPAWRPRVHKLLDRLLREARPKPLMLKDPRVSVLLEAWLPVLSGRFALVVVDRNPLEVAMSVRKRDGRPLYVALALWQLYCTELIDGLAGQRVWLCRYEDLVKDPEGQAKALLQAVGGTAAGQDGAVPASFVSSELYHQRSSSDAPDLERALTGSQLALWHWLRDLPSGWADLHPPAELRVQPEEALVAVNEHFALVADRNGLEVAYDEERHRALHFEQATELKEHHIQLIEAELAHLRRQVAEQSARIAELEATAGALEALRSDKQALERELAALRKDARAAATNLLEVARRSLAPRSAR